MKSQFRKENALLIKNWTLSGTNISVTLTVFMHHMAGSTLVFLAPGFIILTSIFLKIKYAMFYSFLDATNS